MIRKTANLDVASALSQCPPTRAVIGNDAGFTIVERRLHDFVPRAHAGRSDVTAVWRHRSGASRLSLAICRELLVAVGVKLSVDRVAVEGVPAMSTQPVLAPGIPI